MDSKLLEILACPVCKGPLQYRREADVLGHLERDRLALTGHVAWRRGA